MTQLIEYARHEFRLSRRGKDGKSLRETLEVVARIKGVMPEEGINPVDPPDVLYDLWGHFLRMSAARPPGMAPSPILESEIAAYCTNRRIRFQMWELDVIRALDQIALASARDE